MAEEATKTNPITGKWQMLRSENFEEFLALNGANWFVRKMASNAKPCVEVTEDNGKWLIKLLSMVMTREETFTIGEPFEQKQHDGTVSKAMAAFADNKLTIDYEPKVEGQGRKQHITREIVDGGELLMTIDAGEVVCKRWFQRVEETQ